MKFSTCLLCICGVVVVAVVLAAVLMWLIVDAIADSLREGSRGYNGTDTNTTETNATETNGTSTNTVTNTTGASLRNLQDYLENQVYSTFSTEASDYHSAEPSLQRNLLTTTPTCTRPLPYAENPPNFCTQILANELLKPRGLFVTKSGRVLVLERGRGRVVELSLDDAGTESQQVYSIAESQHQESVHQLNHGLTVHRDYIYASSATTVFRWPFKEEVHASRLNY
jgi:hypothetical protein